MSEKVDNRVTVLILQHPQEQDSQLGTAKLVVQTLANAKLVIGLSWRNLGHALNEPADARAWGVLYLGSVRAVSHPTAEHSPLLALDRSSEALPDQAVARTGLKGLVVLDGNWSQAKALWWRNAWLTRLRRFIVVPDAPSLYGNLRKEARPGAVSTLEAVGLALAALENGDVRDRLLAPFRSMIASARSQGLSAATHKPGRDKGGPPARRRDRRARR
jgi:DTW domain-containing protein YfiP